MTPDDRYRDEKGDDAHDRQRDLAKTRHRCCGLLRPGPHHPACRKYEAPATPEPIQGQEALPL